MQYSRSSDLLPPNIDVTKSFVAYGDHALPKINRELTDGALSVQQAALCSLCDLVRNPQNIKLAIDSGVLKSLLPLLANADKTVRLKSTEVFFHISSHALGRKAMVDAGCLVPLSKVFDDEILDIRINAHGAIERSCQVPSSGADVLVAAGTVAILVKKIESDCDDVKEIALATLHDILRVDVAASLRAGGVQVLTALLGHASPAIAQKAAQNIMSISFDFEGKSQAVSSGAVPLLVSLLGAPVASARAAAAGALMSICVTREGKEAAIAASAPAALIAIAADPDDSVKLTVIKAVTALAGHPQARAAFEALLPQLEAYGSYRGAGRDPDAISRFAGQAIKDITWKP